MTNKTKLVVAAIALIMVTISAYHFLVPAGGSSPEVSTQKIGPSAATPASVATNVVPPVLAPASSNIAVPSTTPPIALPSVKISPVPVAAPDAATLASLKAGLTASKRSADLDKLDSVSAKELKTWASSDPQAVITWLNDIPEDNKQHEHALEGMFSLLIDDNPGAALTMAQAINDSVVRDNRTIAALMALALRNPSAATNALNSSSLTISDGLRPKLADRIDQIQSGKLPDEERAKLIEEIHR